MFKSLFILLVTVFSFVFTAVGQPRLSIDNVGEAKAFILVEADSRQVLSQYRATERLDPASITKLMTAYVVYKSLEKGELSLDDQTIISANARNMTKGSRMFLELGSHVRIDDLLRGLVIQSGNDAAIALAEAVADSETEFLKQMNHYAKQLGMHNSHFKNVTGLTTAGHYMSAQDIATLARAIIYEFPEYYAMYKEKSFSWNNITQNNRNALLRTDPSVDGLKTGYTRAAGYCLTTSAQRGGMRLISVVLGMPSIKQRTRASKTILDFGFRHFSNKTLIQAGNRIATRRVINGQLPHVDIAAANTIRLPVSLTDKDQLNAQLLLHQPLTAPVVNGQIVGDIIVKRGEKQLAKVAAVAMTDVDELGFFKRLWKKWFN